MGEKQDTKRPGGSVGGRCTLDSARACAVARTHVSARAHTHTHTCTHTTHSHTLVTEHVPTNHTHSRKIVILRAAGGKRDLTGELDARGLKSLFDLFELKTNVDFHISRGSSMIDYAEFCALVER